MSPTAPTDHRRAPWISLALAGVVVALYAPAAMRAALAFPDADLGPDDPWNAGWVRAGLAGVLAWSERSLTGGSPVAGAWIGALLLAVTAALLFAWLQRRGHGRGASFLVCALWALHPLAGESVFLAAPRGAPLAGLCVALGLLLRARVRSAVAWMPPFVLALAFDPRMAGLGLVLIALDAPPPLPDLDAPPPRPRRWISALVLVALGAAAWRFVPRETASVALTVGERWSHAALALGAFVRRLLLPFDVSLSPPHPAAIGPRSAALLALQAIALAGLCVAGWRLRRRRPALALGGLWFLALAIPHLVSTRDGSLCSARDNHLAAFGLWYALVLEGRTLAQQRGLSPRRRVELGGATLLALVAASALQLAQWTSPRSLARRALALDARNFAAHDVLGLAFLDEGRLSPAVLEHRAALERAPRDARALAQLGVIELRRGLIPGLEGHFHEARRHLEEAVAIVPDSARTWGLLGEVLQRSELLQEAVPALERALELDGTRAQIWTHLGMVRIALGELDGAQDAFEHATRLSPGLPDPVCGLGILRFQAEDFDGAREYLERTIALEPDHVAAHTTLGRIHELRDDVAGAEREYRRALAVNPDHSDALFALAALCEHSGRAEEALRIARRLVELRPTHVRANLAVGRILFGLGDFEGARAALEAVLRLNPEHPEGRKLLEQLPPRPGNGKASGDAGR